MLLEEQNQIVSPEYTLGRKILTQEEFYEKINIIHDEMRNAINKAIAAGKRDFFVQGCPGIGKTTLYCKEIARADKAALALLPTTQLFNQITDWVGLEKKVINLQSAKPTQLKSIIDQIDNNTAVLCTYTTFNNIHKQQPDLFAQLMQKLGYVFSDEMHRGIGAQTLQALEAITDVEEIQSPDVQEELVDGYKGEDMNSEEIKEEISADKNLDAGLLENKNIIHIGFTATPTYSHKSVHQSFECVYHYKTQRGLEEGVITPLKSRHLGDGVQLIQKEQFTETDLERAYAEYYIIKGNEYIPAKDAVSDELVALKSEIGDLKALGVCALIDQIYDVQKTCEAKGLRTYIVHSANKKYKAQGNLAEAKRKVESGEVDIVLVCNTGIEGLDIPSLNTAAAFYAIHSPVKLIQAIGRPGRYFPDKEFAHVLIPPTQIIFQGLQKSDKKVEIKREHEAKTVGRINWQDVYFTLNEFDVEYLERNGIYSREYLLMLNKEKKKREQMEKVSLHMEELAPSRLKAMGVNSDEVKRFFAFLELVNIEELEKAEKFVYDLLGMTKHAYFSETASVRSLYTFDDLHKDISKQLQGVDVLGKEINAITFFTDAEVKELLEQNSKEGINRLVMSALPLVKAICVQFLKMISPGKFITMEDDDLFQECITSLLEHTSGYQYTQTTKYYESVVWQCYKVILTTLSQENSVMRLDNDTIKVFNSAYPQYLDISKGKGTNIYSSINVKKRKKAVKDALIDALEDNGEYIDNSWEAVEAKEAFTNTERAKIRLLELIVGRRGWEYMEAFISEVNLPFSIDTILWADKHSSITKVVEDVFDNDNPDKKCKKFLEENLNDRQWNIITKYFRKKEQAEKARKKALEALPNNTHQKKHIEGRILAHEGRILAEREKAYGEYYTLIQYLERVTFAPRYKLIPSPFYNKKGIYAKKYSFSRAQVLLRHKRVVRTLNSISRHYPHYRDIIHAVARDL